MFPLPASQLFCSQLRQLAVLSHLPPTRAGHTEHIKSTNQASKYLGSAFLPLGASRCGKQGNKDSFCFTASAFILVSQCLYLRKTWFLFLCWQFFDSPSSACSPALCAGVCISHRDKCQCVVTKLFFQQPSCVPFPAAGTARQKMLIPAGYQIITLLELAHSNKDDQGLAICFG